jgi:hypothetical protein
MGHRDSYAAFALCQDTKKDQDVPASALCEYEGGDTNSGSETRIEEEEDHITPRLPLHYRSLADRRPCNCSDCQTDPPNHMFLLVGPESLKWLHIASDGGLPSSLVQDSPRGNK